MSDNAEFTIDSTLFATLGFDALNAASTSLQLEGLPAINVRSTVYSVVSQSPGAPNIAELGAPGGAGASPLSPAAALTITMPASGTHSYLIRCRINGGVNAIGDTVLAFTKERIIAIRSPKALRKMVPAETTQYDAVSGWVEPFDDLVEYLDTSIGILSGTVLANSLQIQGDLVVDDAVTFSNAITDTIAAQADDYAPTGIDDAWHVAVSLTGDQTITGISASQAPGRNLVISCADGVDSITLTHEDVASLAANRFDLVDDIPLIIPPGGTAFFYYAAARWKVIGAERTASVLRGALTLADNVTGTLASDVNDFAPTGIDTATVVDLVTSFGQTATITGISASQVEGRRITLHNTNSSFPVELAHDNVSSSAANRFFCPNSAPYQIPARASVDIIYTATRWHILSGDNGGLLTTNFEISINIAGATVDDYAPAEGEHATAIYINVTSGTLTITGLDLNQVLGRRVFLINRGINDIVLVNNSGASAVGNRIKCPNQANRTLQDFEGVELIFSAVEGQWNTIG